MTSRTRLPLCFRCAIAVMAISQRLSGSKRPILKQKWSAAAASRRSATTAESTPAPVDGGTPFGMTIGFWPHSHIRSFMYRLTVVMVDANASAPQLMRWKPKVLLAFHSITTRSRRAVVQRVGEEVHRRCGLPLLGEHNDVATRLDRRRDDPVDHRGGNAAIPVAQLVLLPVVHTASVEGRQPLAPAVVAQATALVRLLARQLRVADEEQVRLVAELRERARQALHSHAEAAGLAVHVRALEAEDDEDGPLGSHLHESQSAANARSASSCEVASGAHSNVVRV